LKQGKLLISGRKVNSHGQLRTISRVFAGLLGGACLLAGPALADTYRWTDDQGQIIYSQLPPPDDRPYTRIGTPPPPADAAGDKARLEALRQGLADRREDRELSRQKQQDTAQDQAIRDKNCITARANLRTLQSGGNRLVRLPDGSYTRFTPEERQRRVEEAQRYIKENCR